MPLRSSSVVSVLFICFVRFCSYTETFVVVEAVCGALVTLVAGPAEDERSRKAATETQGIQPR